MNRHWLDWDQKWRWLYVATKCNSSRNDTVYAHKSTFNRTKTSWARHPCYFHCNMADWRTRRHKSAATDAVSPASHLPHTQIQPSKYSTCRKIDRWRDQRKINDGLWWNGGSRQFMVVHVCLVRNRVFVTGDCGWVNMWVAEWVYIRTECYVE